MVFVKDPFQQILFIAVPRGVIMFISLFVMNSWFLRIKEVISELLLFGVLGMVYILALGNFVSDLDTKVFYGWLWLYLVLGELALHFFMNTYLVWKLLQDLEFTMPQEVDPSAGLNKKVDLFRLKPGKGKKELPNVF